MAIGGKREGAGRKSQWRSPTKMMRLPGCYENEILEFAKSLDSESESGASTVAMQSYTEMEIAEAIASTLMSLRPGDRAAANRLFRKVLKRLQEKDKEQD
jgi:hypothetical protein